MSSKIEVVAQLNDQHWMQVALVQAIQASEKNEVPVGAAIVIDNQLVASSHNSPIGCCDSTAHAEINVIRAACAVQKNYRLPTATLYVTLEPCTMCLGAILHSRIARVVFATPEPRAGAFISAAQVDFAPFNHSLEYTQGVLGLASSELLQTFFRSRRRESLALKREKE